AQSFRINWPWADRVHSDVPRLEVRGPRSRERANGRLRGGINAVRRQTFASHHGSVKNNRRSIRHQRQRLLYREQHPFYVAIEDTVVVRLAPSGAYFAIPAFAKTISSLPFSFLICAKSRSKSSNFDTSPCTPVTFDPTLFTASSSFVCERPVMNTYAPSFTNCCAAANPMPLLPPVMSATFPSSLMFASLRLMWIIVIILFVPLDASPYARD